jgi:hypothetical protein
MCSNLKVEGLIWKPEIIEVYKVLQPGGLLTVESQLNENWWI